MIFISITFTLHSVTQSAFNMWRNWQTMPHPYLSARSLACLAWTSLTSRRSALVPTNTMSGLSQYALACSWPEKTRASHSNPCDAWNTVPKLPLFKVKICISPLCGNKRNKNHRSQKTTDRKQSRLLRWHVLIQFLTLRKLCWLVKSNISRKPMASLKKAVVRLRNLKTDGQLLFYSKKKKKAAMWCRFSAMLAVSPDWNMSANCWMDRHDTCAEINGPKRGIPTDSGDPPSSLAPPARWDLWLWANCLSNCHEYFI